MLPGTQGELFLYLADFHVIRFSPNWELSQVKLDDSAGHNVPGFRKRMTQIKSGSLITTSREYIYVLNESTLESEYIYKFSTGEKIL